MGESLVFDMSGDGKGAEAAFKRLVLENEKLNRELAKTVRETDKAEKASKKLFEVSSAGHNQQNSLMDKGMSGVVAMTAKLGTLALTWGAVKAGIQIAAVEYQHWLDIQKGAADANVNTASAQIKFMRNMGSMSGADAAKLSGQVDKLAADVGLPAADIYGIATKSISSAGKLSREEMLANVEMSARLAPESQAEREALGTALGGTSRLTGTADPRVNAGLLLQMGEQAPIPSMAGIAGTLVPGAKGVMGYGGTATNAVALGTTLAMAAEDTTGAPTGTAMIQAAGQLTKFTKTGSADEAILKLQADAKLRDKFVAGMSLEEKYKIPVRDLLTPGTPTAELYAQNKGKLALGDEARQTTDQFFANLQGSPQQVLAQRARKFDAVADEMKLQNTPGARASINREGVLKLLEGSKAGAIETWGAGKMYDAQLAKGTSSDDAAAMLLKGRALSLRGKNANGENNAVAADRTGKLLPENEALAKKLDLVIAELRGQRADDRIPKKKNVDANIE